MDFRAGADAIDLSSWYAGSATVTISMQGADTLLSSSFGGDIARLVGAASTHLSATASGFVYV